MGKFLKNFGLGLVYIVLLPILLAILVLFAVYGLGVCIYLFFASMIRFFQGKEMFPMLPEDVKVAEIKKAQMDAQMGTPAPMAPQAASPPGPLQPFTLATKLLPRRQKKKWRSSTKRPNKRLLPAQLDRLIHRLFQKARPQPPVLDVTTPSAPQLSNENQTCSGDPAEHHARNPCLYRYSPTTNEGRKEIKQMNLLDLH